MNRGVRLYEALSSLDVVDDDYEEDSMALISPMKLARSMRRDLLAKEVDGVRGRAKVSLVDVASFQRRVDDRLMKIRKDVMKHRILQKRKESKCSRKKKMDRKDSEERYFPKEMDFDSVNEDEEALLQILFPNQMWNIICKLDNEDKKTHSERKLVVVDSNVISQRTKPKKRSSIKTTTTTTTTKTSSKNKPKDDLISNENDPLSALRRLEKTLSTFETSPRDEDEFASPAVESSTRIEDESILSTKVHPDMSLLEMSVISEDKLSQDDPEVVPFPRHVSPPLPSPHPSRAKVPAWLRRKYIQSSPRPRPPPPPEKQHLQHSPQHHGRLGRRRARLPRKKPISLSPPYQVRGNVSEYIRAGEATGTASGMNWLASLRGR